MATAAPASPASLVWAAPPTTKPTGRRGGGGDHGQRQLGGQCDNKRLRNLCMFIVATTSALGLGGCGGIVGEPQPRSDPLQRPLG